MELVSGLYEGELSEVRAARGERWRRRRAAMLLVDLGELAPLARRLKLAGVRLTGKTEIEAELQCAGLAHGGPVRALCARGLVAYLCHRADGVLSAVRYELRRGRETRTWLVPAGAADGMARLHATGADGVAHAVRLRGAGATAQLAVDALDDRGGLALAVSFIGRRRGLSALSLLRRLSSGRTLAAGLLPALEAWSVMAPQTERRLAA